MTDLDLSRPFTRADAKAAGVPLQVLRTSRFRRLFRDVHVSASSVGPHLRERGALTLHPGSAFLSHFSAAKIYELPVPAQTDVHVSVLRAEDRRHRLGIACHVTTEENPAVLLVDDMRVSHPFRMFLELAGVLDLVDLVIVGDALVRVYGISPVDLGHACQRYASQSRHHAWLACRAASYVRAGVDSPMETRLRLLIVLAGLPEPAVNVVLHDDHGRARRRYDLAYEELRLVIEYDGRQHAESLDQWRTDLERREELDDKGWRILVVTADGIFRDPARILERIRRQLVERGVRLGPSDDGWKVHFPGRP